LTEQSSINNSNQGITFNNNNNNNFAQPLQDNNRLYLDDEVEEVEEIKNDFFRPNT